jgi:hypothetical protein
VHFSEALVPACERATKAAAALGTPAKGDLQAVIAYYNGVGSILEDLSKSMRQVAPPAGDEAEVSGLINDLYQVGDAYGVVAGDLTSGERSVAEHDYGVTQGLINAYDARADAYGLDARCFAR